MAVLEAVVVQTIVLHTPQERRVLELLDKVTQEVPLLRPERLPEVPEVVQPPLEVTHRLALEEVEAMELLLQLLAHQ